MTTACKADPGPMEARFGSESTGALRKALLQGQGIGFHNPEINLFHRNAKDSVLP
jgi:hypothetical protein